MLPLYGALHGGNTVVAGLALGLAYWLLIGVVSSAVQGVFNAALHRYATTKNVPTGFDPDSLQQAWQPRS